MSDADFRGDLRKQHDGLLGGGEVPPLPAPEGGGELREVSPARGDGDDDRLPGVGPVEAGPPTRASGIARFTPATA